MHSHTPTLSDHGALIRLARKALNLGQADVANSLDVTVQAVSQWERGETMPRGINMLKLSGILCIDLPSGLSNMQIPHKARLSELREQIVEVDDLLHALDKIGDGIGGADGFAISAVALNAKSIIANVLDHLRSMRVK
jgi:transcriptional regulator with XRE-family HTH domain